MCTAGFAFTQISGVDLTWGEDAEEEAPAPTVVANAVIEEEETIFPKALVPERSFRHPKRDAFEDTAEPRARPTVKMAASETAPEEVIEEEVHTVILNPMIGSGGAGGAFSAPLAQLSAVRLGAVVGSASGFSSSRSGGAVAALTRDTKEDDADEEGDKEEGDDLPLTDEAPLIPTPAEIVPAISGPTAPEPASEAPPIPVIANPTETEEPPVVLSPTVLSPTVLPPTVQPATPPSTKKPKAEKPAKVVAVDEPNPALLLSLGLLAATWVSRRKRS